MKTIKINNLGMLDVGDESEVVKNPYSGESIKLEPEAVAV